MIIGAPQEYPVAVRLQHGVEIVDTAKVITKSGLPDLNDQCGWAQSLIAKGVELGCQRSTFFAGAFSFEGRLSHIFLRGDLPGR